MSRDHLKSVVSDQSAQSFSKPEGLLKAFSKPRRLLKVSSRFPRGLLKVFLPGFERFQREAWNKAAHGNVCSGDERLVVNLTPNLPRAVGRT